MNKKVFVFAFSTFIAQKTETSRRWNETHPGYIKVIRSYNQGLAKASN